MKPNKANMPSRSLGLFGQVVIGPPGSGKSTYCAAMQEFLTQLDRERFFMGIAVLLFLYRTALPMFIVYCAKPILAVIVNRLFLGRKVAVINLDPANDTLPYTCAVDLKDLIRLDEVMQSLHLGPNGGLLYCMEYLYKNRDWLVDMLTKLKRDSPKTYVLFDCPGQVELYCVSGAFRRLLSFLTLTHLSTSTIPDPNQQVISHPKPVIEASSQSDLYGLGLRLSSVHLVDSHYCTCPGKFISVLLTSLVSMLQLGLPHVNVLSKIDLIEQYAPLRFNLDFFTEVLDLSYLVEQLDDVPFFAKYKKLNRRLAELVQDTALVHFLILDVQDRTHLEQIMRNADKGNGYVFGTDEQRTLQSMLSCASGAEFSNDLVCLAQEKYTRASSKIEKPN